MCAAQAARTFPGRAAGPAARCVSGARVTVEGLPMRAEGFPGAARAGGLDALKGALRGCVTRWVAGVEGEDGAMGVPEGDPRVMPVTGCMRRVRPGVR